MLAAANTAVAWALGYLLCRDAQPAAWLAAVSCTHTAGPAPIRAPAEWLPAAASLRLQVRATALERELADSERTHALRDKATAVLKEEIAELRWGPHPGSRNLSPLPATSAAPAPLSLACQGQQTWGWAGGDRGTEGDRCLPWFCPPA